MMTRALLLLVFAVPVLQDDKVAPLVKELESTELRRVYHAVADLAALGEAALPSVEAAAREAKGRTREYLTLAAEEIRSAQATGIVPPKRISLKAADRNVVELLNDLRAKTGVALSLENLQGEEKLPDAAVDIKDCTMLEAFDAICHAGNVTVTMENGQFMLYQGDYQDLPRFFYSQYFFRLGNYVLMKTATFRKPAVQSFKIQMEMLWDPAAAPCRFSPPVVVEAVDDRGKNLLIPPAKKKDVKTPPDPEDEDGQEAMSFLELQPPTPGAQKIAVLRGFAPISLPKTKATVSFSEPPRKEGGPDEGHASFEGQIRKVGDFTVKISKVEAAMFRIGVEISSTKMKPDEIARLPFLAGVALKGGDLGRTYVSLWSMKDDVAELMVSFQPLHLKEPLIRLNEDRPAPPPVIEKLDLSIVTAVQERRIPFEFRDLKIK